MESVSTYKLSYLLQLILGGSIKKYVKSYVNVEKLLREKSNAGDHAMIAR